MCCRYKYPFFYFNLFIKIVLKVYYEPFMTQHSKSQKLFVRLKLRFYPYLDKFLEIFCLTSK